MRLSSIGQISLLKGLSQQDREVFVGFCNYRLLPRGSIVVRQDVPETCVYLLMQGTTKVAAHSFDKGTILLTICGPGEAFGDIAAIDDIPPSATVTTLERCHCLVLASSAFRACLQTMPYLAFNFLQLQTQRIRRLSLQNEVMASLRAEGRVAHLLLSFATRYGVQSGHGRVKIPMHLSQSDLAALTGLSRVRVNQVLHDFREQGVIAFDKRHYITVLRSDSLALYTGQPTPSR